MKNVLLTSVGRRSYIVEYFKNASNGRCKVICTNMYYHTAGMYAADKAILTLPSCDSSYIGQLIEIIQDYNIGLICSFHDLDTYVLSQNIDILKESGAIPILPCQEWGRIALDKYECYNILKENGFRVPWSSIDFNKVLKEIHEKRVRFPLVVKNRMGFGSQGLSICNNFEELKLSYKMAKMKNNEYLTNRWIYCKVEESILIQKAINGKEYCIDIVNDLKGSYVSHFITEIHEMRAGESDVATTVNPKLAGELPKKICNFTKHIGIWGVDCIKDKNDDKFKIIDINPRFTGDYPFNHIAGANIPSVLLAWVNGTEPNPKWFKYENNVKGYKDIVPNRVS